MDAQDASRTLEVIRTLMERTCQYQFITARAGLVAGCLAGLGALSFLVLDANDPLQFALVWGLVFLGSLLATVVGTATRVRERGEKIWSRQTRAVVAALCPAVFTALALSVFLFVRGHHLWLPGVWMLCYGQGAMATAVFAPAQIRHLGIAILLMGAATLALGPYWAVPLMGVVFGLGHIWLGLTLLAAERREGALRVYRSVA